MHVFLAGDFLDADHRLMHRLVGEPRRADEIADRVDAFDAGLEPLVDHDMAAIDFDALDGIEAAVLDVAGDADRENDFLGRDGLRLGLAALHRLDGGGGAALAWLESCDRRAGDDGHPLLLELLAGVGRDVFVFDRQHAVHDLDHVTSAPIVR